MRRASQYFMALAAGWSLAAACSPYSSELELERVEPSSGRQDQPVLVSLYGSFPAQVRSSVDTAKTRVLPMEIRIVDASGALTSFDSSQYTRDLDAGTISLTVPSGIPVGPVTFELIAGAGDEEIRVVARDKYTAIDGSAVGDAGVDDGHTRPSCSPQGSLAALGDICGPAGTSPCCHDALVPGGAFYRSYDVHDHMAAHFQFLDESLVDSHLIFRSYPATVSAFRLDTYEVTVGRFRRFVEAGHGTRASPPLPGAGARTLNGLIDQGGWNPDWNVSLPADTTALLAQVACGDTGQRPTWTAAPGGNEAMPMNCLTWYVAFAFCVWDGGFLPSAAEWNFAASGGDEQRAYPWSSPPGSLAIDCARANWCLPPGYNYTTNRLTTPALADPSVVGTHSPAGDGRWGHADLAGNVLEWALDWFDESSPVPPYPSSCDDCAYLSPPPSNFGRVVRGGAFTDSIGPLGLRSGMFGFTTGASSPGGGGVSWADPVTGILLGNDNENRYVGVRCARRP